MSEAQAHSFRRSPVIWPLLGIVLLVLANLVHDRSAAFLSITLKEGHLYGSPVDIFSQGSRCMLVALGMTLVIAVSGVDLAVGSLMAVGGAVAAVLLAHAAVPLALAIAAALAATALAGLLSGVLVAGLRLQPIVATLILMVMGRGVAQLITNENVATIQRPSFDFLGNGYLLGLPFAAVLVTALYFFIQVLLRRTAAGLFLEAAGDNETASRFAGLAVGRVKGLAYVASGVCAGLAGLLAASNIRAADPLTSGLNMELDAIFAVVVGGTALTGGRFSLLGSWVGALLLQTLTVTMYNLGVTPAVAPVPKALLIITVCLLQSEKSRRWLGGLWRRPT
ncbi:MAG TPA: ABC transporter permease [Opitutaceae bacterium]|nr:ABC transporter permease [Opitutaceae bacterium]